MATLSRITVACKPMAGDGAEFKAVVRFADGAAFDRQVEEAVALFAEEAGCLSLFVKDAVAHSDYARV